MYPTGQYEPVYDGRAYPAAQVCPPSASCLPGEAGQPLLHQAHPYHHQLPSGVPPVQQEQPAPSKVCGVCGDRAKSLHFGGMACDSCKAFFRRSVQNEAYKHFRCAYDGHCHITMTSRKSCQNCRFNKCVDIGMEKSWVMTEEERIQQSKLRQEKKLQKKSEEENRRRTLMTNNEHKLKPHQSSLECRHNYLTNSQVSEIELLLDTFYKTYQTCPPPTDIVPEAMSCKLRVVNVFANTVFRLVQYASNLPRFRRINANDRAILLKHGVLAMTILRGTMVYDTGSSFFSLKTPERRDSGASISIEEMRQVLDEDLCRDHFKFFKAMKTLQLNEATLMILQMVVLFSSDRIGLTDPSSISKEQEFYTDLVHRYMRWWYGEENTKVIYPKMLHRLVDLRSLTEAHSDNTVSIPDPDFNNLLSCFVKMGLNPYPEWDCFTRRPVRRRNSDNSIKSEINSCGHTVRSRSWDRNSFRGNPTNLPSSSHDSHTAAPLRQDVSDETPLSYTGHVYVRRTDLADDSGSWQEERQLYSQHWLPANNRADKVHHTPSKPLPPTQHHHVQTQQLQHHTQPATQQQHHQHHLHHHQQQQQQHHHQHQHQQQQQPQQQGFMFNEHHEAGWQHGVEVPSQHAPENLNSHWNSVEGLSDHKLPESDTLSNQLHKTPSDRHHTNFVLPPSVFSSQDMIEFGTMFGPGIDKLISGAYDLCTERCVSSSFEDSDSGSARASENRSSVKTEQQQQQQQHLDDHALVSQVLTSYPQPQQRSHQSPQQQQLVRLDPGQQLVAAEQLAGVQVSNSSSYSQDGIFPNIANSAENSCYSHLDQWQ